MTHKKSNIKWRNIILFLIFMVGLISLAQFFLLPDMEGWSIDRVILYETSNDLSIQYEYEFTEAYDYGTVIAQEGCERIDPCDAILTISIGKDQSGQSEEEIRNYLAYLVENYFIEESQIQTHSPEYSDEVNAGYAILYAPNPRKGIIELTFSLGPEITMEEAHMVAVGKLSLDDLNDPVDFSPLLTDIKPYIRPAAFAFLTLTSYSIVDPINELIDIGFNMFSQVNGWLVELSEEEMIEVESQWEQFEEIITVGSTNSQEKRDEVAVIEQNGIKVALLAYMDALNDQDLPEETGYLPRLFNFQQAEIDVEKAKKVADVIVVSMNWEEANNLPSETQQEQAQWLADLGVHVILGSGSNVLQPIDILMGSNGNETLIAYSLGNFLSGHSETKARMGGILNFEIQKITIRDDVRTELKNLQFMPSYHYYDSEASAYRLIPLADSDQDDLFETLDEIIESSSDQIKMVKRLSDHQEGNLINEETE